MSEPIPHNTVLVGDAATRLKELPAASVDMAITSPPYFRLRDYGVKGQIGAESTVHGWVAGLQAVFREVARVLVPTGSLFVNVGDSFSTHPKYGAPKSLVLAPERLLLALAQDGWIVRNKLVWAKTNPLPSSVTDRFALTYEPIYFLVRQKRYFFDLDAVREPYRTTASRQRTAKPDKQPGWTGSLAAPYGGLRKGVKHHPLGKNPGDMWHLSTTKDFRGAHPAIFPTELVRRPILAACPALVCTGCGDGQKVGLGTLQCGCHAPARRGRVLDVFMGAGTTAVVAEELGRDWLGVEINPEYVAMTDARLAARRSARS